MAKAGKAGGDLGAGNSLPSAPVQPRHCGRLLGILEGVKRGHSSQCLLIGYIGCVADLMGDKECYSKDNVYNVYWYRG